VRGMRRLRASRPAVLIGASDYQPYSYFEIIPHKGIRVKADLEVAPTLRQRRLQPNCSPSVS
jgi:hypothetical protein